MDTDDEVRDRAAYYVHMLEINDNSINNDYIMNGVGLHYCYVKDRFYRSVGLVVWSRALLARLLRTWRSPEAGVRAEECAGGATTDQCTRDEGEATSCRGACEEGGEAKGLAD